VPPQGDDRPEESLASGQRGDQQEVLPVACGCSLPESRRAIYDTDISKLAGEISRNRCWSVGRHP